MVLMPDRIIKVMIEHRIGIRFEGSQEAFFNQLCKICVSFERGSESKIAFAYDYTSQTICHFQFGPFILVLYECYYPSIIKKENDNFWVAKN